MAVYLSYLAGAGWQFFSNNGVPLTGGKLYTYAAGTTTPATTYTTDAGNVANSNPIILNSAGRLDNEIWLSENASYKFVLKDANDVLIGTYDDITGVNDFTAGVNTILADLADTSDVAKGDALVGFKQSNASGVYASAVARTVHQKFQEMVSARDFGAVGDGVADDTAALQAAITAVGLSGLRLYVPAGTYKITSPMTTTADLYMFGDGESTVLDFSSMTGALQVGLTISGTLTQIQDISSASQGNVSVAFASTPSLVQNDVFVIYNTVNGSFNSVRDYYRAGEWCEVRSISGTTANLTNMLYSGYTAANCDVYKLSGPSVYLSDFKIKTSTMLGAITVSRCRNVELRNLWGYAEGYQLIEVDRCYMVNCDALNFYNKGRGSDDYSLVISNSQHVKVTNSEIYARRHGITIGGGDTVGCVPNRDVRIINCTLKNDVLSGVYSADMHGNMEDCGYIGCTIYGGAGLAGKDTSYDNCTIFNALGGWCVYGSEIKGGNLSVRNSRIITFSDPSSISRGVFDFGGNSTAISTFTNELLNIIINNCTVRGSSLSSSTDIVMVAVNNCDQYVNIFIEGLYGQVNAASDILRTRLDAGTAYSQAIVVDNVSNFPAGADLHLPQGAAFRDFPHRLMRQSGSISLTATSGTAYTIANTITYRYPYPRTPQAAVTSGGDTAVLYNGNRAMFGGAYQVTSSDIRPYIESGDATNWSSSTTVNVSWTVGISEI